MATHTDAVAQVYARSLYELADEAGGTDKILEIAEELEQIAELARSQEQFHEFLASPIIEQSRRADSLRRIFANNVTDLFLRFLLLLNNKDRLNHLDMIHSAYDQIVQESFGRIEVDLFTPTTLGQEQLAIIGQRIQETLGKEPVLHSYTDDQMIGGLKLRIGDQLIDGSISRQLQRLEDQLLTSDIAGSQEDLKRFILDDGGSAS